MPDYLSPGVYIEELPPQLQAIQGVSTSIAGFVGVAGRGPVPGFALPFTPLATDPMVVALVPTPTPALVSSYADFTRQFGAPLPLPDPTGVNYLGYAVLGFFNNGGQILYIARVAHADCTYGSLSLSQGVVLQLQADVTAANVATQTTYAFSALRGLANGEVLSFYHKNGGAVLNAANAPLTATVASYSAQTAPPTITFTGVLDLPSGVSLSASDIFATTSALTQSGPTFWARNPGAWSGQIAISVTPSRRRAVSFAFPAAKTATEIQIASTSGFYIGAIIEIDTGAEQTYAVVSTIGAGGVLGLKAPLGLAVAATATARIIEIDITLVDSSPAVPVTESYTQLTWNPDPVVSQRHYATVINAQSQLVYVQPPGVGGAAGSETATIASQPTTFNGWAFSITSATAIVSAVADLTGALTTLVNAAQALETTVSTLSSAILPLPAAAAAPVTTDAAALTAAANTATALVAGTPTAPGSPAGAVAAALTSAAAAANAAVTAATSVTTDATVAQFDLDSATVKNEVAAVVAAAQTAATATFGSDGTTPDDDDFVGVDNGPGQRTGIQALKDAENISMIAAPGQTDQVVQDELINQCELLASRFAILDGEQNPAGGSVNAILTHRDNYDTFYAAYYVPWLQITLNNQNVYLPPSGHMAGIYAGTDNSRGVWKAPANVVVQNITGLKTYLVKGDQDILNPVGVNAIRRFDTLGTRVWGARTLSSDDSLIYINVRRTLIFLEQSIDQGTQWVVFEPNTPDTWDRLTDSVSAFLTTQWAAGALFGAKPSDSFFVQCDETTMTADDIQNGRLICNIGVAIVRPAEFVIFRIQQTTGYANQ